ncbi:HNH endonuclease [candidate division WOR-3 bacterium]|nr:HNH endonuclease [candidate division WOR-3 bacterium]
MYSIDPVTGCWNVVSHIPDSVGYIQIKRNCRQTRAHRYSWELACGPIPNGLFVRHHCDNPICINPEHLFLGTNKDNMQDAARKGKIPHFHGEAHGSHKLTATDVQLIRQDKISTLGELGKKFGIGRTQVRRIKNGENWKHIPLPKVA